MRNFMATVIAGFATERFSKAISDSPYLGDPHNFECRRVFDFFSHRNVSFIPVQLAIFVITVKGYFLVDLPALLFATALMELSELVTIYAAGRALIAYESKDFNPKFWRRVTMIIEVKGLFAIIAAFTLGMAASRGYDTILVATAWLTTLYFIMFVTSRSILWTGAIIGAHIIAVTVSLNYSIRVQQIPGFGLDPNAFNLPILLYVLMCFASAYLLIRYTDGSLEKERAASIKEREADEQRKLLVDEKLLLATIQNNLSEAIVMTDSDGKIAEANKAFYQFFPALSSNNIFEQFDRSVLKLDRTRRSLKTNNARTMLVEGMTINLAPPNPSLLFIFIDISDKVAADERNQQLQKINVLGTLASGIAHDFNNYLSVIQSNTELILHDLNSDTLSEESYREMLHDILRACLSSAGQTRRLLRFTRKLPENPENVDTKAVCQRALSIARSTLGTHYQIDVELDVDAKIFVDPSHFETAILNLFINARDAMPSGGRIIFRAERTHETVTIQVIDKGPGIPASIIDHVTEPFFTTKPEHSGSGIGLSNVKQFVEQYQGYLNVVSTEGDGAKISLTLPISQRCITPVEGQNRPPRRQQETHGKDIILIDDNTPFAKSLEMHLCASGHIVRAVNNVGDFKKTYETRKAELIICDVVLENENGLEVYEIARSSGGDEPVLFISGNLPTFFQNEIEKTKNTWFLEKPFTTEKLMSLINEISEQSQYLRAMNGKMPSKIGH